MSLGLVSCSLVKKPDPGPAKDVYYSRTFRARMALVEKTCDAWMILSSVYGLITPHTWVEHYDDWLEKWSKDERKRWQDQVGNDVMKLGFDEVHIHAGAAYYAPWLESFLVNEGLEVKVPTRGLTNLQTFSWLKKELERIDAGTN